MLAASFFSLSPYGNLPWLKANGRMKDTSRMGPLSRPNCGSGHWSQSTFGSFQSAARPRSLIAKAKAVPSFTPVDRYRSPRGSFAKNTRQAFWRFAY